MKVFRVVTERDTSTEIIRCEYRYAAEDIRQAWHEAIALVESDPEQTLVAVHVEHEAITILAADEQKG